MAFKRFWLLINKGRYAAGGVKGGTPRVNDKMVVVNTRRAGLFWAQYLLYFSFSFSFHFLCMKAVEASSICLYNTINVNVVTLE